MRRHRRIAPNFQHPSQGQGQNTPPRIKTLPLSLQAACSPDRRQSLRCKPHSQRAVTHNARHNGNSPGTGGRLSAAAATRSVRVHESAFCGVSPARGWPPKQVRGHSSLGPVQSRMPSALRSSATRDRIGIQVTAAARCYCKGTSRAWPARRTRSEPGGAGHQLGCKVRPVPGDHEARWQAAEGGAAGSGYVTRTARLSRVLKLFT